jgi:hypothetical protein
VNEEQEHPRVASSGESLFGDDQALQFVDYRAQAAFARVAVAAVEAGEQPPAGRARAVMSA